MITRVDEEICVDYKEADVIELNSITGDTNYLYDRLKESIRNAKRIDIIVSFLMESGVKLILRDLEEAVNRGVPIRILTGNYLKITQPGALYLLKGKLKDKVDLRFYNVPNRSFHPKSYIFHMENDCEIYIGSSNVSYGALTKSIEWNYKFKKSKNSEDFDEFYNTFEDLFLNQSIIVDEQVMKEYASSWKKPKILNEVESIEKVDRENNVVNIFEPKGAQIEALYELQKTREDGFDKALVVMATGVGKTYLAAFDSLKSEKILFVAHREEIIKQAARSFGNVRSNHDDIGYFYNDQKDNDKSMIFALVQTLGKEQYLNPDWFAKDYFDYIIIDEFHHAVSGNYRNIINYFEPKFLLGLTATPERLDSKDVFSLCNYNNVYEVRLRDAINRGYLVPFRYYGIYDDSVDYSNVEFKNGKYNSKELEEALSLNKRAELIFNNYSKYNSKRALGFCSSKNHALYMADYFNKKGIKSLAVYSNSDANRNESLEQLTNGEVQVIFSVDMFNEGLDIPSIDMVMFLRPTESPTIFLQQLGRGLRKSAGKKYLNVLDFIGNYKKANLIPFLLSGKDYANSSGKKRKFTEEDFPEDCLVNLDFKVIDIFKKLEEKEMSIKDKVIQEFFRVKDELGHRPSRLELFLNMDEEIYINIKSKAKELNPFKDYLEFLKGVNELNPNEKELYLSIGKDFINMIESTGMSKSYKMPVLLAFYNDGNIKLKVSEDDIYESFYKFYHKGSNKVDMLRHKSTKDFEKWNKDKYVKLAKDNPIKFLAKSHSEFFEVEEGSCIKLNDSLKDVIRSTEFKEHMKDAIEFRIDKYYRENIGNI